MDECYPLTLEDRNADFHRQAVIDWVASYDVNPLAMTEINSGVIGVKKEWKATMELAEIMVDELYPLCERFFSAEQFAIGLAAQVNHRLTQHPNTLIHYWPNKPLYRRRVRLFADSNYDERLIPMLSQPLPKPAFLVKQLYRIGAWLLSPKHMTDLLLLSFAFSKFYNQHDAFVALGWGEHVYNQYAFHNKDGEWSTLDKKLDHPIGRLMFSRQQRTTIRSVIEAARQRHQTVFT